MTSFQDLGGSQYRLRVTDEFSTTFRRLRAEMDAVRREFTELQGALQASSGGAREARERARAAQEEAAALRDLNQQLSRRGANERTATAEANRALTARIRGIQAELKQQQQNETLRSKILRAERSDAAARVKAAADAAEAAEKSRLSLGRFFSDSITGGNRLLFTLRRLIGALAIFTAAREGFNAIKSGVVNTINFNAQIEDATAGVAALLAQLGQFRKENGELASGPEALTLATATAEDQLKKLRLESLRVGVSFAALSENFQIALGQGVPAGLQPDAIRKFTVQVSQAAQLLRIPQNQLPEEIRSLLIPGAATTKNSKIFTTLGFTKAQIETAREAGKLPELFEKRFNALAAAADNSAGSFSRLTERLRALVQFTAGEASVGFFDALKVLLKDVGDAFVTVRRSASGAIESISPNPRVLALFKQLFDFMTGFITRADSAIKTLDFAKVQVSLQGVLDTLQTFINLFISAGQGVGTILAPTLQLVAALAHLANQLGPVVAFFFQLRAILFVVGNAAGTLGVGLGALIPFFEAIGTATAQLATSAVGSITAVGQAVRVVAAGNSEAVIASIAQTSAAAQAATAAGAEAATAAATTAGAAAEGAAAKAGSLATRLTASLTNIGLGLTVGIFALKSFLGFLFDADFTLTDMVNIIKVSLVDAIDLAGHAFVKLSVKAGNFVASIGSGLASIAGAKGVAESLEGSIERANRNLAKSDEDRDKRREESVKRFGEILAQARARAQDEAGGGDFSSALSKARAEQALILKELENDRKKQEAKAKAGLGAGPKPPGFEARPKEVEESARREARIQELKLISKQKELLLEQDIIAIKELNIPADRAAVLETEARLRALDQQRELQKELSAQTIDAARKARAAALAKTNSPEEQAQANAEINNILEEEQQKQDEINLKIRETNNLLREQQQILNGTVDEGFLQGLRNFASEFGSQFKAGIQIASDAVNQFGSFISGTISDAFDPRNDTDFQTRFAEFLLGLQRSITDTLTKLGLSQLFSLIPGFEDKAPEEKQSIQLVESSTIASTALENAGFSLSESITTSSGTAGLTITAAGESLAFSVEQAAAKLAAAAAAASASGVGAGAAAAFQGGAVGMARGGGVKPRRRNPSPQHLGMKWRRPKGLHPSDTQPVWLALREFVQPVSTVMRYGADLMEGFRRGQIDVEAARSLIDGNAFSPRVVTARATRVRGFAGGGSPGGGTRTISGGGRGTSELRILPVLVETERNIDRIMAGENGRAAQAENSRVSSTLQGVTMASRQS